MDTLPPRPPVVLYSARADDRDAYETHLKAAAKRAGMKIELYTDPADVDPARVEYLVFAANGPIKDFSPYTNLKLIQNLWAGIEAVLKLDPPRDVPFARMVEDGLTLGMIDYVCGHVLRHHIDIDRYIGADPIAEWEKDYPPLARDRTVGILGVGALGAACGCKLSEFGFRVLGWSRSAKRVPGIDCFSGEDGLRKVLKQSEILVLLLPLTSQTERLMNARRIGLLPRGGCIVNAGRGPLIEHGALLEALDAGHIRHATMDVFDEEPLPPEDPYWRHPRVTVTPHIASVTRPETASEAVIAQICRAERGDEILHLVDYDRGY